MSNFPIKDVVMDKDGMEPPIVYSKVDEGVMNFFQPPKRLNDGDWVLNIDVVDDIERVQRSEGYSYIIKDIIPPEILDEVKEKNANIWQKTIIQGLYKQGVEEYNTVYYGVLAELAYYSVVTNCDGDYKYVLRERRNLCNKCGWCNTTYDRDLPYPLISMGSVDGKEKVKFIKNPKCNVSVGTLLAKFRSMVDFALKEGFV